MKEKANLEIEIHYTKTSQTNLNLALLLSNRTRVLLNIVLKISIKDILYFIRCTKYSFESHVISSYHQLYKHGSPFSKAELQGAMHLKYQKKGEKNVELV